MIWRNSIAPVLYEQGNYKSVTPQSAEEWIHYESVIPQSADCDPTN